MKLFPFSIIVGTAGAAAFVGDKPTLGWRQQNNIKCAHLTTQASLPVDDPRVEPRVMYKMDIRLPLGLTLEEIDTDPSCGVVIVGITPEGNAGEAKL